MLGAVLLAGCDGTISVTFWTGAQELEISMAAFELPPELEDGTGHIAEVECGPTGMCPPSTDVVLTCESGRCNPAPMTLSAGVGKVFDLEASLAETREIGVRRIESYTVEQVEFDVRLNTVGRDIGPVEIFWGPEAASAIDPALGVHPFGTVPVIEAGTAPGGAVAIDPDGRDALSEYLARSDPHVRFFARTVIDLEPGDPYPRGGTLRVGVNVRMTVVGRVFE